MNVSKGEHHLPSIDIKLFIKEFKKKKERKKECKLSLLYELGTSHPFLKIKEKVKED